MIFISGHSYAISSANTLLFEQGKQNFFCREGVMSSEELIDILNSKLTGNVTSEQVTESIVAGLTERYPCDQEV